MERDLTQDEFKRFHDLIYQVAGIHYPVEKISLLSNRIRRRLRAAKAASYDAYLGLLGSGGQGTEMQAFLDSITTNETYFFRCQRHWDFFRQQVQQKQQQGDLRKNGLRLWSAAASTGAEAFTMLIVLHQVLGDNFGGVPVELLGTDLSNQVLEEARAAAFRPYALAQTPPEIVQRYFTRSSADQYVFDKKLAAVARFQRHNLMDPLPGSKPFDFVFVRNVMIYFDNPSRERVLGNAFQVTKPGGFLVVGESESLLNVKSQWQYLKPSIFQRPAVDAPTAPKPAGRV